MSFSSGTTTSDTSRLPALSFATWSSPKHGSWLNLIETFFAKMTKTMLRGIRVSSKDELKERIETYLDEVNETPVVFRWKYGLDSVSVV